MRAQLGKLTAGAILLLADNIGGLAVIVGGIWLYRGTAGFSKPAADMLAGLLLMLMGTYPYLRRR